jgi:hypothetical protein
MLYRCIKVQHKPIKDQIKGSKAKDQRTKVCPGLAHRTVSGAPGPHNSELAIFGFLQRHSAIIHRTVRCATGLSGAPAEQRLFGATVDCTVPLTSYSSLQKSEHRPEAHRTVNSPCLVRHRTFRCH